MEEISSGNENAISPKSQGEACLRSNLNLFSSVRTVNHGKREK